MASSNPLRIGFVPEHFSTPLYFAAARLGLHAILVPFPSGTGHMITSLRAGEIDVGIGLTEAWVAGLASDPTSAGKKGPYKIIGTYVESPLCWAISTGKDRGNINGVDDLRGAGIGVSRIGSGSYVMGFVLADSQGWLKTAGRAPFEVIPLDNFAKLREGVNSGTADFFMWEHFTSKRYHDNGDIKRVGEIYTPWSSWMIVAANDQDDRLRDMLEKINKGVQYFEANQEEAVEYIHRNLDYSEADARAWLGTVKFAKDVGVVDVSTVNKTIETLKKAGIIEGNGVKGESMIELIR